MEGTAARDFRIALNSVSLARSHATMLWRSQLHGGARRWGPPGLEIGARTVSPGDPDRGPRQGAARRDPRRHEELDQGIFPDLQRAVRRKARHCEEARKCRQHFSVTAIACVTLCTSSGVVEAGCKTGHRHALETYGVKTLLMLHAAGGEMLLETRAGCGPGPLWGFRPEESSSGSQGPPLYGRYAPTGGLTWSSLLGQALLVSPISGAAAIKRPSESR